MRFGASEWLWGTALGVLIALVLIVQGFRLTRDKRLFGMPELIDALLTEQTSVRRSLRAVLLVLAVILAALAAAAPQYGRGTRVLPATNLDVVLVLDYSKSMYAKDVSPSRMKRAKVEVARLIAELGGARFGAVAFAGDTMAFPVTSDGAAIAQFFRGLEPVDMPIGGTSIARALETAKELLARDPLSARHERVIVLVTDGEDLEGDPAEVATRIAGDGTRIEVVQIGGRTPEPMYQVDENGTEVGLRRDGQGQLMTTFLTPEGEEQLAKVAAAGGGEVVRAEKGQVGIDHITTRLQKLMTEELSERVETVYADVYQYPLCAAILLLLLDVVLSLGKRRKLPEQPPRGGKKRRLPSRMRQAAVLLALGLLAQGSLGCADFDRLFVRDSPVVKDATLALSQGKQKDATDLLTKYLETGACEAGVIGAGERARRLGDASLDLGLALAGAYPRIAALGPGKDASKDPAKAPAAPPSPAPPSGLLSPGTDEPPVDPELAARIDCALRVLSPVAENPDLPSELRARAHYLMGNLELSRHGFQPAIDAYDRAIVLAPGLPDAAGDAIGRDIAHNRALAQRRLKEEEERKEKQKQQEEEQKGEKDKEDQDKQDQPKEDQAKDPAEPEPKDQDPKDQDPKGQDQPGQDQQDKEQKQAPEPADAGGQDQAKEDDPSKGQQANEPAEPRDGGQKPDSSAGKEGAPAASQDARILDRLEQAPTLQQYDAKQKARTLRLRPTMEDK